MKLKLMTVIAVAACATLVVSGLAAAGSRIDTKVTIQGGGGDYFGYVKSPKPRKCARERKVKLLKQLGAEQHPRTDTKIGSDITSKTPNGWQWNTGSTGVHTGKVYARAPRTEDCKADSSRTIQAS